MTKTPILTNSLIAITLLLTLGVAEKTFAADTKKEETPKEAIELQDEYVLVMYFHRTNRCQNCQKMNRYVHEVADEKFAKEKKAGQLTVKDIDLQAKENAEITKAFGASSPTLVVARVKGDKIVEANKLTQIWKKHADQEAFYTYVEENIKPALKKLGTDKK